MILIGVIAEHNKFDDLRKIIQKETNKNEITLININKKSINNLKNVKFDSLVFLDLLENEDIYINVKYLVINSDIEIKEPILSNVKANIITYGMNHKSTVTFSSITDEMLLISVQRQFKDINNRCIEVGEYEFKISQFERVNLHEILVQFIIKKIYNLEKK